MTSRPWRAAALLAPAALAAVALATPAAAATAAASPSWQLTNQFASSPACYPAGGGSEYLEIDLSGSWSVPLSFGASGLPAGGSSSDYILYFTGSPYTITAGGAPMPPGSSNGTGPFTVSAQTWAEAYAITTIPSGLKAGSSFTITLWASDGTTKQTETVPIDIKASCARRY